MSSKYTIDALSSKRWGLRRLSKVGCNIVICLILLKKGYEDFSPHQSMTTFTAVTGSIQYSNMIFFNSLQFFLHPLTILYAFVLVGSTHYFVHISVLPLCLCVQFGVALVWRSPDFVPGFWVALVLVALPCPALPQILHHQTFPFLALLEEFLFTIGFSFLFNFPVLHSM